MPGLQVVSADPFIITVADFLSVEEIDTLTEKLDAAADSEKPSSTKLLQLGDRTSTSAILKNAEVDGLRRRIARLANVSLAQMQPLKLTRYEPGAVFKRHTDCTAKMQSAVQDRMAEAGATADTLEVDDDRDPATFPDRFCTVLLYLNDCPNGAPRELCVSPRRGMAVLHFPCTGRDAGLVPDFNADHESECAGPDTKLVCQQFIWSEPMDASTVHPRLRDAFREAEQQQPAEPLSEVVL